MHPAQPQRPVWKPWHKATLAVIGGIFVLILVIVVIAAANSEPDEPDAAEPTAWEDVIPEAFGDYLAALDAIDPGITEGREDRHVFLDADNTCLDIEQGKDEETLVRNTMLRFGVNDAAEVVTEDVAAQILEATRSHCDMIRAE